MDHKVIELGATRFGGTAKSYQWSLANNGLEMGTGVAGTYEEHAHRHYVDLIYSPAGLRIPQLAKSVELLIVPPGVRFGPTTTDNFFFAKFLPTDGAYSIPDKVSGAELASYSFDPMPSGHSAPWLDHFDFYAPRVDRWFRLTVDLSAAGLIMESNAGWGLTVRRSRPPIEFADVSR